MATGTVVTTEITHKPVKLIKWVWTSTNPGAIAGDTTDNVYTGKILGLATDPSATAPDDNYNVEVFDDNGLDVLIGSGKLRDTADTEYVAEASLGAVVESKLTLSVDTAGAAKIGTVYLYIGRGGS